MNVGKCLDAYKCGSMFPHLNNDLIIIAEGYDWIVCKSPSSPAPLFTYFKNEEDKDNSIKEWELDYMSNVSYTDDYIRISNLPIISGTYFRVRSILDNLDIYGGTDYVSVEDSNVIYIKKSSTLVKVVLMFNCADISECSTERVIEICDSYFKDFPSSELLIKSQVGQGKQFNYRQDFGDLSPFTMPLKDLYLDCLLSSLKTWEKQLTALIFSDFKLPPTDYYSY